MKFEEALKALKEGKKIHKVGWKKDIYLAAQFPDEHSKMNHPYIYISLFGENTPYPPNFLNIFVDDWEIYEDSSSDI